MQKEDMLHQPITSPLRTIDYAAHAKIADEIAAFIKRGRKITQVPVGVCSDFVPALKVQMETHRNKKGK